MVEEGIRAIILGEFAKRALLLMRGDHSPGGRRVLLEEFLLGDLWLWSVPLIVINVRIRLIQENVAEKLRLLLWSPLPTLLSHLD